MPKRAFLPLLLLPVLLACLWLGGAPAAPTASPPPVETQNLASLPPTDTPPPTAYSLPSPPASLAPADTATPVETQNLASLPTETPSETPTLSETPTPTETPTPSFTPLFTRDPDPAACLPPRAPYETGLALWANEGDTLVVDIAGAVYSVRYIGIDAPVNIPYAAAYKGPPAAKRNQELTAGRVVRLYRSATDYDAYGQLLRYVVLDDGVFLNYQMVEEGLARAIPEAPDVACAAKFSQAEEYARANLLGLWAPLPPTPVPSATRTPRPTFTLRPTSTPRPSATPGASPTPSLSPTTSLSPTVSGATPATLVPSETLTPSVTLTPSPTPSGTVSPSPNAQ
jgi:endonuclease YncB( thermonuclease family)